MMRETIFPFSSFSDGSSTFSIDLEDITKLSHKSLPLRMRRNFGMENSSLVHFFSRRFGIFSIPRGNVISISCMLFYQANTNTAHFTESPLGFSWEGSEIPPHHQRHHPYLVKTQFLYPQISGNHKYCLHESDTCNTRQKRQ